MNVERFVWVTLVLSLLVFITLLFLAINTSIDPLELIYNSTKINPQCLTPKC